MINRAQLSPTTTSPLCVQVANGQSIQCTEEVKGLQWWIQGHTFQVDTKVISLGAYDIIPGLDWLEQHNPMTCDWKKKWIQFEHNNELARLQGVKPTDLTVIKEMTGEQLYKLYCRNDIWVTTIIAPAQTDDSTC